jgi:hypothetical protein
MEKSNKRGKIPQQDWPSIMARYDAGETLASIARTYDCSPPAISYIVSRSRARSAGGELPLSTPPSAPSAAEPQLVKAHAAEPATSNGPRDEPVGVAVPVAPPVRDAAAPPTAASDTMPRQDTARPIPPRFDPRPRDTNGEGIRYVASERDPMRPATMTNGIQQPRSVTAPAPAPNGEARRTLHLSLGGPAPQIPEPQPAHQHPAGVASGPAMARPSPPPQPGVQDAFARPLHDPYRASQSAPAGDRDGHRPKDGGPFIDQTLRDRVDGDIAAFLAAFDAALAGDTQESRAGLREATDRLLRAGARTRIELERLEARVPLPARDHGGQQNAAAWRQR